MKRILFLFFIFSILKVNAQNEFTATAFYKDFKSIYNDAQGGFLKYRGEKRLVESNELYTEYNVKLLLPLADSGKIVVPAAGSSYVIYYFEPEKMRLKVDQRGANLIDAVLNVLKVQLIARTETTIIDKYPFTNSWYFIDPNEKKLALAAFKMSIYFIKGKYNLSFEIRGTNQ